MLECCILIRGKINPRLWQRRNFPILPRRKFSGSSPPSDADTSKRWFQAGALLMGLVVLEQGWQRYQDRERKTEFQSTLAKMQQDANRAYQGQKNAQQDAAQLPALFTCQVIQTHKSLNGTLMLQNVQLGDMVQVVTAEVGPDQAYHLCRSSKKNQEEQQDVGWYPREFLKQIGS